MKPWEETMNHPYDLRALGKEIIAINTANGWKVTTPEAWHMPYKIPTYLTLIHTEISEAMEAFRHENTEEFYEECADVFIRILDMTEGLGIDVGMRLRIIGEPGPETDGRLIYDVAWKDWGAGGVMPTFEKLTWDDTYHIPALLAFMHLELSRALLAFMERNAWDFSLKISYVIKYLYNIEQVLGFDLDDEIRRKLDKNKTRGFKHGNKRV